MYSITSNDCDCDQYLHCGKGWIDAMRSPWYPTSGQPLIYCAQVRPAHHIQRNGPYEKDKPNCFKKAFRWYTEEHVQPSKVRDSSGNVKHADFIGFATWLDDKYNEYLRSNQNERLQSVLNQSSVLEYEKTSNNYKERPMGKKQRRIKSPWRKRRKDSNTNDKGDVMIKSNQSIEVILKPQNLSRTASECCQRTKVQSCCNRSNSTIESYTSTLKKIAKPTSKSWTEIYKERELCSIPFDVPQYDKQKQMENTIQKRKRPHARDVSCQCSKDNNEKVDTSSQYDERVKHASNTCACYENTPIINTSPKTSDPLADITMQRKIMEILLRKPQEADRNVIDVEKNRSSFERFLSSGIQTSDYCINLDQKTFHNYPLFMKIICADKLKEN